MNSPSESVPVQLTSPRATQPTHGEVQVQTWDKRYRTRRAIKTCGIAWGCALVAVLIPGLHFILVPSFLFAGPILASWIYNQKIMILGGKGTCPACGQPFEVLRTPLHWPINDVCAKCHDAVTISPLEPT